MTEPLTVTKRVLQERLEKAEKDAYDFAGEMAKYLHQIDDLKAQVRYLSKYHPDFDTPNWCSTCSPKGIGYCRCEIACNE